MLKMRMFRIDRRGLKAAGHKDGGTAAEYARSAMRGMLIHSPTHSEPGELGVGYLGEPG
jgi:hypothetical protein